MEYKKVSQEINDITNENLKKLQNLFPSVVKDGLVDFDALKEELGEFEEVDKEKYEFIWSGKKNAKKIAQGDVYNRTLKYVDADSKNPDITENIYIEGDNLEVLKLLRQNYYGAIKMIYIDPPYNTDGDFVYNDKFAMNSKESDIAEGIRDEDGNPLQKNSKSSNRYHANWLNMIYPRLKVAKDLLTDDGVIFISIDDNEQANLKKVCDEIFGEKNFVNCISVKMSEASGVKMNHQHIRFPKIKEHILFYKKNGFKGFERIDKYKIKDWDTENNIFLDNFDYKDRLELIKYEEKNNLNNKDLEKINSIFSKVKKRSLSDVLKEQTFNSLNEETKWLFDNAYRIIKTAGSSSLLKIVKEENKSYTQEIAANISSEGVLFYFITDFNRDVKQPRFQVLFADRGIYKNPCDFWQDIKTTGAIANEGGVLYKNGKKPLQLLKRIIKMTTKEDDIILDYFAGSSSTAHATMDLNVEDNGRRKFIMVQVPDNIDYSITKSTGEAKKDLQNLVNFLDGINKPHLLTEIGKERIRRAGEKIKEKIEKENENIKDGEVPKKIPDIGFKVFRVDDTNIKWNEIDNIGQMDMEAMKHNPDLADFKIGFNDTDIVYEVMLRQKDVPLSATLETLTEIGDRTYIYGSSYLVCLETNITEEMVEKLSSLNPLPIKFIFRDSAFKDNINLKDETFRRLKSLIEKNSGNSKMAYTVEFI